MIIEPLGTSVAHALNPQHRSTPETLNYPHVHSPLARGKFSSIYMIFGAGLAAPW